MEFNAIENSNGLSGNFKIAGFIFNIKRQNPFTHRHCDVGDLSVPEILHEIHSPRVIEWHGCLGIDASNGENVLTGQKHVCRRRIRDGRIDGAEVAQDTQLKPIVAR